MNLEKRDPVIEELRQLRRCISQRFDHDPVRLVEYYMQLQKQYENRLIRRQDEKEIKDQSAA